MRFARKKEMDEREQNARKRSASEKKNLPVDPRLVDDFKVKKCFQRHLS
jgi:hypothetical protein